MATIILTGGGTAGHVTPHLALLPYLQQDFEKIYYFGSEKGIEKSIIEKADLPYYSIPCAKLNRFITLKNLSIPFSVTKGIRKAKMLIEQIKPDIIFSKGGYVALPVVIAGKMKGIPIISHESDYTVGLANKITSKFCKKVLTSFPETAKTLINGEHVGAPIRKNIANYNKDDALKYFNFSNNKPILLVIGGSQGSKCINDTLRNSLSDLLPKFNIIHICGKNNLCNEIEHSGYFQTEYMNDIEKAFSIANLCVSRAGSNSVFELASIKIPTLLIPLPKDASRGDQILNAEYFQKLGLVNVLHQNVLTKDSFTLSVNSLYANRFNIIRNFDKYPIVDASRKISRILFDNMN